VVFGHAELAVALAIATSAVLAYKEPLHGVVGRIDRDDLYAGLKLLIATFIVLPVLPDRPLDPWDAINPYQMWWLVILISGLSLVGYVATRWLGAGRGIPLTGVAGGLVSSTAVTLAFARQSRDTAQRGVADALAAGVLIAWAMSFARVVVEVLAVHPPLLGALALPVSGLAVTAAGLAAASHRRSPRRAAGEAPEVPLRNPFSLSSAIRFALFFAVVLLAVALARRAASGTGLVVVAALAGLTDVDAITLSMAAYARDGGDPRLAARAIVVAALSNSVVKVALVAALGSAALRARIALASGVLVAVAAVLLALG
jgi:uncharacterized membrane protein (DUF4010 family)